MRQAPGAAGAARRAQPGASQHPQQPGPACPAARRAGARQAPGRPPAPRAQRGAACSPRDQRSGPPSDTHALGRRSGRRGRARAPSSCCCMARAVPRARYAGPAAPPAGGAASTRSRIASASSTRPRLIWFTAMPTAAVGSVSAATCASAPAGGAAARPGAGARAGRGAGGALSDAAAPLASGGAAACARPCPACAWRTPPHRSRPSISRRLRCARARRAGSQGMQSEAPWHGLRCLLSSEPHMLEAAHLQRGRARVRCRVRRRGSRWAGARRQGARRGAARWREQRLRLKCDSQVALQRAAGHRALPQGDGLLPGRGGAGAVSAEAGTALWLAWGGSDRHKRAARTLARQRPWQPRQGAGRPQPAGQPAVPGLRGGLRRLRRGRQGAANGPARAARRSAGPHLLLLQRLQHPALAHQRLAARRLQPERLIVVLRLALVKPPAAELSVRFFQAPESGLCRAPRRVQGGCTPLVHTVRTLMAFLSRPSWW